MLVLVGSGRGGVGSRRVRSWWRRRSFLCGGWGRVVSMAG